jgi:hypothetical protein
VARQGRGIPLFTACRSAAAAAASLLTAGAIFALLCSTAETQAKAGSDACEEADVAFLASPVAPWKGASLRVLLSAEKPIEGELSLIGPDGQVVFTSRSRQGGPPYSWFGEVAAPAAGTWQAKLTGECGTVTREIAVRAEAAPKPHSAGAGVWPVRDSWNRETENLYSAWIEKLFDAPLDDTLSWPALHVVLRDKSRNFLFNHLELGEDEMGMVIRPDCADLPYFLRAYFAFKMGLPYGFSKCSRGGGGKGPHCVAWTNILNTANHTPGLAAAGGQNPDAVASISQGPEAVAPKHLGLTASFGAYLRTLADGVHSGSARTYLNDNNSDYYPVPLTQETLRPGVVYPDPYGHVLMVVKRIAQTKEAAGVILAVDGQPDGTVSRKRFWRGNFLFAQDPANGGPGFKRFRPIVRGANGALRRLSNEEIGKDPQYADFSLEQSKLGVEDFYDRMDEVMSPAPLDPMRAMTEAIAALDEQVKARVTSVENGRKYQNGGRGDVEMPAGSSIFETAGAWEDFATPSRDLRLLIAIDVVRAFPDRVARRPNRYAMPAGRSVADVKVEMERVLASELFNRKFSYLRSDGSTWTLALQDVVARQAALEMAYNLNDCVELRWGAPERSDEASTCKRHASSAQRAKMTEYRAWFHERRRPPRA